MRYKTSEECGQTALMPKADENTESIIHKHKIPNELPWSMFSGEDAHLPLFFDQMSTVQHLLNTKYSVHTASVSLQIIMDLLLAWATS